MCLRCARRRAEGFRSTAGRHRRSLSVGRADHLSARGTFGSLLRLATSAYATGRQVAVDGFVCQNVATFRETSCLEPGG